MPRIGNVDLPGQKIANIDYKPGTSSLWGTDALTSNYIVVNDSGLLDSAKENACVILFDWVTFANDIIAKNTAFKTDFFKALNEIIDRLGLTQAAISQGPKGYSEVLNKAINKSLMEFKTTTDTNLGSSSCSFKLENFEDKWIIKDKQNIFYGQSLIQEGIKFVIDVKGRFNTNIFYRIWTGYIVSVSETSDPTDRSLTYNSIDSSRQLSYTRWNTHPAIHESDLLQQQINPTVYGSNLQGQSGADIVQTLTTFTPKTTAKLDFGKFELWNDYDGGAKNNTIKSDSHGYVDDKYNYNFHFGYNSSDLTSYDFKENKTLYRIIWGHTNTVYAEIFKSFVLNLSEFKTRKDILTNVASVTFYKIYLDGAGNLHYHPPRFEEEPYLVVTDSITKEKENPLIHCLFDDEIIGQSYTQSEVDVCTVARGIQEGDLGMQQALNSKIPNTFMATIVWEDGINRFGFRERQFTTAAFKGDDRHINAFTAAFLLRANQERFQMSATIPMRPEIQIDRPIYDYTKDKVYYIRKVTHTYMAGSPNSGGTFTTSVDCSAGRRPDEKISSNVLATANQYATVADMVNNGFTTLNIRDLRDAKHYSALKTAAEDQKNQQSSLGK